MTEIVRMVLLIVFPRCVNSVGAAAIYQILMHEYDGDEGPALRMFVIGEYIQYSKENEG